MELTKLLPEPEAPVPAFWRVLLSIVIFSVASAYAIAIVATLPNQDYGYVGLFVVFVFGIGGISYVVCTLGDERFTQYYAKLEQCRAHNRLVMDLRHEAMKIIDNENERKLQEIMQREAIKIKR